MKHVESDLRPGAKWMMRGVGMALYRGRRVSHNRASTDWQEDGTETIVRWDLDEKDGVTTVRLTHSGFTTETSRAAYRDRPQVLRGLQAYVEQA